VGRNDEEIQFRHESLEHLSWGGSGAGGAAIALGSRVSPYSSWRAFSASTRPSVKMISQSPGASVTVADSYFASG
jgi:hypothetical protein